MQQHLRDLSQDCATVFEHQKSIEKRLVAIEKAEWLERGTEKLSCRRDQDDEVIPTTVTDMRVVLKSRDTVLSLAG